MTIKITTDDYVIKARKVHGTVYGYSKVVYTGSVKKLIITCRTHGDFKQRAYCHLNGAGCKKCTQPKETTEVFIEKAVQTHGKTYNYSKTIYKGAPNPVIITCPIHGDFEQGANHHLRGRGCKKCSYSIPTTKEFISKAQRVHGSRYNYDNLSYAGSSKKVLVTCKIHGDFSQRASCHLNGQGCSACFQETRSLEALIKGPKESLYLPRQIYFIKFYHRKTELNFYKVGVCDNKGLKGRYPDTCLEKDDLVITDSSVLLVDNYTALATELYVLNKFRNSSLNTQNIMVACHGGTETFSIDVLHKEGKTLQQLIHEALAFSPNPHK